MTANIPSEIREQVLILWLRGYSRDEIARRIAIGAGTVSDIIKSYNQRNPEFALLREYVVAVKKEGVRIKELASAIRLKRILESHNLGEEQIDSLLNKVSIHCFKKDCGVERFIENVDKTSYLADTTGVAIENLPDHIRELKRELYSLTIDLMSKKAERDAVSRECDQKKIQLEDLNRSIAKAQTRQTIRNFRVSEGFEKVSLLRALAYYIKQWTWEKNARAVLAYELAEANKSLYFIKWALSELTNPNKKNR